MATEWSTVTLCLSMQRRTFSGVARALQDRAGDAVAQRKKQIVTEGADEAPFAGGHDHIVFLRRQPVAVQIAEGDDPAVRVDDAFGFAGGARGVDDESRFVGGGIGSADARRRSCSNSDAKEISPGAASPAQTTSLNNPARRNSRTASQPRRLCENQARLSLFQDTSQFAGREH